MKKNDARMPALRKSLAIFNAGLLMFALVATNFPLIAIAQTTDVAPAVETEVVEEVVEEAEGTTDESTDTTNEVVDTTAPDTSLTDETAPPIEEALRTIGEEIVDAFSLEVVAGTATLHATKIVCDDESLLPNWGDGKNDANGTVNITATTASDFLLANPDVCHTEPDWEFQWVKASDANTNPGDNAPAAASPWNTITTDITGSVTTSIPSGSKIWIREVLENGYVPFTGIGTAATTSAEMYCNTDVLNYDNYEQLTLPVADTNYYCVAFNAPEEREVPQSCTMVSDDDDTYVGTENAVEVTYPAWTTSLSGDGAKWIWTTPDATGVNTFTRSFNVTGAPGTATLEMAADNTYSVSVNGGPVALCNANSLSQPNHGATESCTIPVVSGMNTIEFTVTNTGGPSNPDAGNPAGLYYKISFEGASCTDVPPNATATVTMCKVGDQESPLSGWTLMLKGDNVQSGLLVPSTNSTGVNSNPLVASVSYIATAMGTWNNQGGANVVDSEYSTTNGWSTQMDGYTGYQNDILELQIDSEFDPGSVWGAYNSAHTYAQAFTVGANGPANFRIFDGTGTTQNESWFSDNSGNLSVSIDEGYAGVTGENGCVVFEDVPYGSYTAGEILQDGWTTVSGTGPVVVDEPEETFTIVNTRTVETPDQCVIVSDATTLEGGFASVLIPEPFHTAWTATMDTLAKWIWGEHPVTDPTADATEVFTKTFWLDGAVASSTLLIAADNSYSITLNGNPVGADATEFNFTSAGQDVITLNAGDFNVGANTLVFTVKNWAQAGGTQAKNPAGLRYKLTIDGTECDQTPPPQETVKVYINKSLRTENGTTHVTDGSGAPAFPMTSSWDAANIGAGSGSYTLAAPTYGATTSPMTAPADYTTAETTDGSVVLPADAQCAPGKYRLVGYKTGTTLIEAENAATSTTAPVFTDITSDRYVIVVNEDCDEVSEEPDPTTLQVHIYKHLQDATSTGQVVDGANVPDFPMTATWTTANLNGGATTSGAYVLGNNHGGATFEHAANTALMDAPADYTTSEVTDGSVVVANGEQCAADKYRLVGYKWGTSYADAVATTTITVAAPEFTDLTSDRYVIVVNEDCDDVLDDGEPTGPDEETIVVTDDTSAGENQLGWMFNRDTGTQSPFAFQLGNASIGTGSLYVEPITNTINGVNDKFIGELFLQEQIADIDSISYDFKIAAPDATVEEQFYMSVYANFGESSPTKFYDCRYSVLPVTGSTGAFTTVAFDPTQSYPVATRTGGPGVASPYPCPASPAGMDLLSASSTIRAISLNVGDTTNSDTGVSGYLDKVVVALTDLITTYDFEPATIIPTDDGGSNRSGGGGGSRSSVARSGSVLGATTDAACSALLSTFMKIGAANDAVEVVELQGFLNEHMGAALPLTGFFGAMTDAAVHAFQKEHWEDVLKPWFLYPAEGIHDADDSTGYVYKTTQWKINDIYCPDIAPFPPLP